MAYIDGYVIAVPNSNKQAYLDMAVKTSALFKKHGATRVVETWGDDVPEGKLTSFTMAVKREDHESIVFSMVEWPSKAVRDASWKSLMADPAMQMDNNLFDGKRMIFGGFDVILDD
ncbi:MAG: DUF1428 domain-containing protein [Notoacmeibacter sp.]